MCVTLPPTMLLSYPCLCMRIFNLDKIHQLVYISLFIHRLPCGNINDTPVYSRVKCYSGIPCACGFVRGSGNTATPKLASAGIIAAFPMVTLVSANSYTRAIGCSKPILSFSVSAELVDTLVYYAPAFNILLSFPLSAEFADMLV